jgi:hypothetical protein
MPEDYLGRDQHGSRPTQGATGAKAGAPPTLRMRIWRIFTVSITKILCLWTHQGCPVIRAKQLSCHKRSGGKFRNSFIFRTEDDSVPEKLRAEFENRWPP